MSTDRIATCDTPNEIAYFRLASLKGQLKLESKGLKMSTGRALRPQIAAEFGLKPRDSYDKFITVIQGLMDKAIADRAAAIAKDIQ